MERERVISTGKEQKKNDKGKDNEGNTAAVGLEEMER